MEMLNNELHSFLLCIIVKVANIVVYPEVCSVAPRSCCNEPIPESEVLGLGIDLRRTCGRWAKALISPRAVCRRCMVAWP